MKCKKIKSLVIFLLVFNPIFSQSTREIIENIFDNHSSFIEHEIPDTFMFHYKAFLIDYEPILNAIMDTLCQVESIESDTLYYMHANGDADKYKNWGMIWCKEFLVSFYWNNWKRTLKIYNEPIKSMEPFMTDLVEWNENICNRSYTSSDIAGSSRLVCTKLIRSNYNIYMHTAFRLYNKFDSPWLYLKEKAEDNFKGNRIVNTKAGWTIEEN